MVSKAPDARQNSSKKEKGKSEIVFSKELLESVKQVLQNSKELKPSEYYDKFVNDCEETIEREKGRLDYINEEKCILFEKKLKKMIKNQYYMMFQKDTV